MAKNLILKIKNRITLKLIIKCDYRTAFRGLWEENVVQESHSDKLGDGGR